MTRSSLFLQQYDFEIQNRAGKNNANADGLSRRPYCYTTAAIDLLGLQISKVYDMQRKDPDLSDIILYLEDQKVLWEHHVRPPLRTIEDYYLDDKWPLMPFMDPYRSGKIWHSFPIGHSKRLASRNFDPWSQ